MATTFDISPERRAGQLHFLYRQLFLTPPPVDKRKVDFRGKLAIVTGANGGIGLETARILLDLGCEVILAVRDEAKGDKARQLLIEEGHFPSTSVRVWPLDLSKYDTITAFAERCKGLERLDIAILNAGVYKAVESFGPRGWEESVQINYLSNMLLVLLLLPIIKEKSRSSPGHICVVSSDVAAWSKFKERSSDPLLAAFKRKMRPFDSGDRYGTTKLLGQLFITELAKHIAPSSVTLSCANPGLCRGSELGREATGLLRLAHRASLRVLGREPTVGARAIVHAVATVGEHAHGQYVEDAKVQPMAPIVYKPEGVDLAKKLYEETLDELGFAGVRQIVDEISRSS